MCHQSSSRFQFSKLNHYSCEEKILKEPRSASVEFMDQNRADFKISWPPSTLKIRQLEAWSWEAVKNTGLCTFQSNNRDSAVPLRVLSVCWGMRSSPAHLHPGPAGTHMKPISRVEADGWWIEGECDGFPSTAGLGAVRSNVLITTGHTTWRMTDSRPGLKGGSDEEV